MFVSSLTLPRLLDDVWLLVHWLLVCWLWLLVEGLNCSLGEGLVFSCKKSINKQRQYYPSSPVLAPDTTVVSCFSFLSSPNSSTSSAVGLTLSVLSDSDLRGLMTCLTPPTWDTYQYCNDMMIQRQIMISQATYLGGGGMASLEINCDISHVSQWILLFWKKICKYKMMK